MTNQNQNGPVLPERAQLLFRKYFTEGKPDECWLWTGSRVFNKAVGNTYGKFTWTVGYNKTVTRNSHNVSFRIKHGRWRKQELVLRHSCHNVLCVNPAHLFEGTQQDNLNDALKDKRIARGERLSNSLTDEKVLELRSMYASRQYTQKQLSEKFGISQPQVSLIVRGKAWSHLSGSMEVPRTWKSGNREEVLPLSQEKEERMKLLRSLGVPKTKISKELGVSISFLRREEARIYVKDASKKN